MLHTLTTQAVFCFSLSTSKVQLSLLIEKRFKDTLKAFDDFNYKQKNVWSNVFWYVKVCIFWKCIQYTINWDKTQIFKKFTLDKINYTKNALFFLSQAPIHHNFTFNLCFLYELKNKVRLSKTMCGIFHCWFRFVLINKCIFLFDKIYRLFDFKTS